MVAGVRRWLLALLLTVACSSGDPGPPAATTAPPTTPAPSSATAVPSATPTGAPRYQEYDVPAGSAPHDVAVADDGTVWYTAQASGELGRLDPRTGKIEEIPLGDGSRPHGVVLDAGGAPWITDTGLNAMVRVDPATRAVKAYPVPKPSVGLNTAVVAGGSVWFTGAAGWYGRVDMATGRVDVHEAPRGNGPYGITATAEAVYYASLAGDHVARVDPRSGAATVLDPPVKDQGSRRVWADSTGRVWASWWDAGEVAVYDPATKLWRHWRLPGDNPMAYAVYVDSSDVVWLSDFGANALVRFEPSTERFTSFPLPSNPANVRQIHGRPGEVWGAESAADKLVVLRL